MSNNGSEQKENIRKRTFWGFLLSNFWKTQIIIASFVAFFYVYFRISQIIPQKIRGWSILPDVSIAIFMFSLFVFIFSIRVYLESRKKNVEDELFVKRSSYVQNNRVLSKVLHYSEEKAPVSYNFLKIDGHYFIEKNGDTRVIQKCTIEVLSENLLHWNSNIVADASSDPMEYLESIQYSAHLEDLDYSIFVFPEINEPKQKKIHFILGSPAKKGDIFTLHTSYKWPGLLKDLLIAREANFWWDYSVKNPNKSCDLSITLDFDEGLGPINCSIVSARERDESVDPANGDVLSKWIYRNRTADVANNKYEVVVRRIG